MAKHVHYTSIHILISLIAVTKVVSKLRVIAPITYDLYSPVYDLYIFSQTLPAPNSTYNHFQKLTPGDSEET